MAVEEQVDVVEQIHVVEDVVEGVEPDVDPVEQEELFTEEDNRGECVTDRQEAERGNLTKIKL